MGFSRIPGLPSIETGVDAARIRVPVLLVHHKDDSCRVTLAADVPEMARLFANAAKLDVIVVEGGRSEGPACEARAHHGFLGVEREVVARISGWIKANAP